MKNRDTRPCAAAQIFTRFLSKRDDAPFFFHYNDENALYLSVKLVCIVSWKREHKI